jgi:hypothetical protein
MESTAPIRRFSMMPVYVMPFFVLSRRGAAGLREEIGMETSIASVTLQVGGGTAT